MNGDLFQPAPPPPNAPQRFVAEITLAHQIACVRREIGKRRGFYPKWVAQRRMTQAAADLEIDTMCEVLRTLEDLARAGVVGNGPKT